jgi:hypothetical protein
VSLARLLLLALRDIADRGWTSVFGEKVVMQPQDSHDRV